MSRCYGKCPQFSHGVAGSAVLLFGRVGLFGVLFTQWLPIA